MISISYGAYFRFARFRDAVNDRIGLETDAPS
jgi:hypothetical protein